MIRAFLLANATAATFLFRRLTIPANHWLAWLACCSDNSDHRTSAMNQQGP